MPSDTYRAQKRGGRGIVGLQTREQDFVENIFICRSLSHILFFTNTGRMYRLKAYQIPESGRQAKGIAIVNLLQLEPDEKITAVIPIEQFEKDKYLLMMTKRGTIKKTPLMDYDTSRKGGIRAINLSEDDELIRVKLTDGNDEVIICTHNGMAIRFHEHDVRPMGRIARGVRGIRLDDNDYVVGMNIIRNGGDLLVITENGYGKRTDLNEYRTQTRGGKGVSTYRLTDVTGNICGMSVVTDKDDIMLITSEGIIIRMDTQGISKFGRVTKGVKLMRLDDNVKIVGAARVEHADEEE
jgi:DNA gyrase subunit A